MRTGWAWLGVVIGIAACDEGGPAAIDAPVGAGDASIDGGLDAALVDAALPDAAVDAALPDAAVDAVVIDAPAIDAPAIDASVPEVGQLAMWGTLTSVDGNLYWHSVVGPVHLDVPGRVAFAMTASGIGYTGPLDTAAASRDGITWGPSFPSLSGIVRGDVGATAIVLLAGGPSGPSLPTRTLELIDTTTQAHQRVEMPAITAPALWDAASDGATLLVGADATVWRVSTAGVVLETHPLTDFALVGFDRDQPSRAIGLNSAGAPVIEDVTAGTRTVPAVPPDLADLALVPGSPPWIRGTIGGAPAVAPLGSAVATVLPVGTYRMDVDGAGRLIAVQPIPGRRSVAAIRIDDARLVGSDGATRLDPTYGGDGQAELLACTAPCTGTGFTLLGMAVAGDGSVALAERGSQGPPGFERATITVWWFDPPP